MRFHITDTFEFLRRVPQPSTVVTRQMTAEQAQTLVNAVRTHYAHFSDGVHARAAERALGLRLHDNREDVFEVVNGDRVLVVGTSDLEWMPDRDTQTVCDRFVLLQVVA